MRAIAIQLSASQSAHGDAMRCDVMFMRCSLPACLPFRFDASVGLDSVRVKAGLIHGTTASMCTDATKHLRIRRHCINSFVDLIWNAC